MLIRPLHCTTIEQLLAYRQAQEADLATMGEAAVDALAEVRAEIAQLQAQVPQEAAPAPVAADEAQPTDEPATVALCRRVNELEADNRALADRVNAAEARASDAQDALRRLRAKRRKAKS